MSIENSPPFNPDERRKDALMDGAGFSNDLADRLQDEHAEGFVGSTELPPFARPSRRRRPLGRAAVDGSGREESRRLANLDAINNPVEPVIQHETNLRGRAQVEAARDEAFGKDRKIKAIEESVNRDIPIDPDDVAGSEAERHRVLTARLRTYFDSLQTQ